MYRTHYYKPKPTLSYHVKSILTNDSVQAFGLFVLAGIVLGLIVCTHLAKYYPGN